MTREELDKIASDYLNDCESESDMLEVFAVAKEALEYEDIRDCNTCTYNENGKDTGTCQLCMHDNQYKQEPKTGHWIDTNVEQEWYDEEYVCSECKGHMLGATEFCPYCGSRMESEDKE